MRDAYRKYGNREFGSNNYKMPKYDKNRHVNLVNITEKEVGSSKQVNRHCYSSENVS